MYKMQGRIGQGTFFPIETTLRLKFLFCIILTTPVFRISNTNLNLCEKFKILVEICFIRWSATVDVDDGEVTTTHYSKYIEYAQIGNIIF